MMPDGTADCEAAFVTREAIESQTGANPPLCREKKALSTPCNIVQKPHVSARASLQCHGVNIHPTLSTLVLSTSVSLVLKSSHTADFLYAI